ncbi:oxygenase MpaB family protein [Actinokineospora enzanensis]|uniref:oxygenase MpaB family protein n=1 Tax=Actinokineospora enzanensis TaxID=155975 RepID=UPI00036BEB12|nr:oxygenase MpaB family protein [Actinokineospora enzanensis]
MRRTDLGLFGPDSVTWQLHADPALLLGGIRSLYLQALHPRAVAAVVQNSDFRTDPFGRLMRTAAFVGISTYGTETEAHAAAERVRRVHSRLKATDPETGEVYPLDDPELLLWVHCAEVASFLSTARRAGYPLRKHHADRYLREQRVSASLVGLAPDTVPGSTEEMTAYLRRIRPALRRTPDSDDIYDFLHRPPLRGRGLAALGLRLYEPAIGHVAYSLLPPWATGLHGRRPYPRSATTVATRALRQAAFRVRGRIRSAADFEPPSITAVRRLGAWATPSADRLPDPLPAAPRP